MKKLILNLILVSNLTGCAGLYFSKNGDVISKSDLSSVDFRYRSSPPVRKADQVNPDGTEVFRIYDEIKWCGLTIWAIIPVPLWLPVCRSFTEVTYKDGKPISVSTQRLQAYGGMCGPFVQIVSGNHRLCSWDR